jgi:hypothetical protein
MIYIQLFKIFPKVHHDRHESLLLRSALGQFSPVLTFSARFASISAPVQAHAFVLVVMNFWVV